MVQSIPAASDLQEVRVSAKPADKAPPSPTTTSAQTKPAELSLNELRKAIPASCFEKSLPKSLFYMFFDYGMWFGSLFLFSRLVNSALWPTLPLLLKAVACLVYWNVAGFFMWCIFVVGHDCGHTTFSEYPLVNDILGHVMHSSILVPFYPWQLSHRRHHLYHNHEEKDYSYAWATPNYLADDHPFVHLIHSSPVVASIIPFVGWFFYLAGAGDGCHFLPIPMQKMWKETPWVDYAKCLISSLTVVLSFSLQLSLYGSWTTMALYYLAPLVMFAWWLVTVTYLQHHNETSTVYTDADWTFVNAAFETVDRKYGYGLDALHHNITDGHLVHHLFFTQIPHYHLMTATEAVQAYLQEKGLIHKYRFEETFDFPLRVHSYMVRHGFRCTLYGEKAKMQ